MKKIKILLLTLSLALSMAGSTFADGIRMVPAGTTGIKKEIKIAIAADTTWADIIPAGYLLEFVIIENTTANTAILDLGTADGENDVFSGIVMDASSITTIVVNQYFSSSAATSLDLNDDQPGSSWNSGSFTVTLIMRKII